MPAMHFRRFTVRGRGEFPLDMLRYDSCWPRTGEDVAKITPTYDHAFDDKEALDTREVRLCCHTSTKREAPATNDRWRSFGWQVIEEE